VGEKSRLVVLLGRIEEKSVFRLKQFWKVKIGEEGLGKKRV
jgi:hypothetical protein